MAKTVWMRPASEAHISQDIDVSSCAMCGQLTGGRGAIVEVLIPHGGSAYRAICDDDARNPDQVAAIIREAKTPHLRAV